MTQHRLFRETVNDKYRHGGESGGEPVTVIIQKTPYPFPRKDSRTRQHNP